MAQEKNTEQLIIEAAKKIFVQRGLAGARMQDIADEAGINKAMLHYYYRSKEKLFEIVFNEALDKVMARISYLVDTDMPLDKKIAAIVENYINGMAETPYLPIFVLSELSQQPEMLVKRFKTRPVFPDIVRFMKEITAAGKKGLIKKVNPVHLLLNILSMCVFPYVARPLVQGVIGLDNAQYRQLMEERKQVVTDTVLSWLQP